MASAPLDTMDRKAVNVIEVIDLRAAIAREIERKWREAKKYII
jgi:hypothetical protein